MTDEARMMDDGCTNEPALPLVTGEEIHTLLDLIESLAENVAGEYGNGLTSTDAVLWAAEHEDALLAVYTRLRMVYPRRDGDGNP